MDPQQLLKMLDEDDFGLLELPVKAPPVGPEDRLQAGFQEIADFVVLHGREPELNPADMAEAKLAMRLKAINDNEVQRLALEPFDELGLLSEPLPPQSIADALADDPAGLLSGGPDIFELRHVPEESRSVTPAAEKARREPCEDFERFEPLFKEAHAGLRRGERQLLPFESPKYIQKGCFYVVSGVMAYVADEGARETDSGGRTNARLRVIYENGTESPILLQSFAVSLYKGNGKRVTEPDHETVERMGLSPDTPMASVYVLRSLSQDLQLGAFPDLFKIGATSSTAEQRVAQAAAETTFLGAAVEIVEEYRVPAGVEKRIEHLLHRLFAEARVDAWFERAGRTVAQADEWFALPFKVIDEAINLIEQETIVNYEYDGERQQLQLRR